MNVDLRRGDIGVSQHLLHGLQRRASFKQVCGKAMAQSMGRYPLPDAGPEHVAAHDFPCPHPAERPAQATQKDNTPAFAAVQPFPQVAKVVAQGRGRTTPLAAVGAGLVLAATLTAACSSSDSDSPTPTPLAGEYRLAELVSGEALGETREFKTELAPIPGVPDEALVALQTGLIYRVSLGGNFAPQPWGDLSSLVTFDMQEQGLLSLAFSPDFADDGTVFAYYTPGSPEDTVLARFQATATELDESSRQTVITVEEHDTVHQGGHIVFDHEGYLMLSLGDGGFSGDALEVAQELDRLLGKVIRIDVSEQPYTIPPDNPFVGVPGAREEIFAVGFRNPWRMTIDRLTGDVWLGDVGEGSWEEVDHVVAGGNYGWDCFEGLAVWEDDEQCEGKDFIDPE